MQNRRMKTPSRAGRSKTPRTPDVEPAYHHGDLKNALLREGRLLLEEKGVAELSLRECARRVGVSEAAPARHFAGKEGLLASIAADGFRDLAARRLATVDPKLSALAKARQMMAIYVKYAQENKGVFNLMIGPRIVESGRHAELLEESRKSFDLFSNSLVELALECGWPRSQVELVAHGAWAVEHGLATLILADRAPRPDRNLDVERMIDFSIDMALSAVVAGPAAFRSVSKSGKG
jgi:AcrR family transcriptional regulator